MSPEELFNQQKEWAERGLMLARELLPLMSPVGQYSGWSKQEGRSLGELLAACARSSESVLLLCAYGQVWDADVLSRSVVEGTLKVMYLLQSRKHFQQRMQEYSQDLFQISLLKDHRKVKELLDVLPDPNAREWLPFREKLLSDAEIGVIEAQYDRATRRAVESKWGFTGLVGELVRSDDSLFAGAPGFCYGYATASHILHADTIGVGIALERDLRSEERRTYAHLAHVVRLIVDQLVFFQTRLIVGYRFVEHPPDAWVEADKKIQQLRTSFGDVHQRWLDVEYGRA